ncbi:MAG: NADH-quinone oxidoreductase subunit D, partial [Planctomycetes bacterium]|nr:NADH-quinone oxidoreductase subunit D [Planctomycetota bacterium]
MNTAPNPPPAARSTFTMNFGPQHPATHGTLHLVLELDGEVVVRADPQIGYLHTGFEKLGEHRSLTQFVTLTDRLNYMSPLTNNIGLVYAAERMLGVEPTPRCVAIRVVLAELSRIADHIICCGLTGMDLGAFSVMLWCFEERERLYDIFEA